MSSRFEPRWPTGRPLAHVPGCKYIHSNKCLPAPCSASGVRHLSRESGDKAAGRQAWENGQQWRGRYGLPLLRRSRSDLVILFDFGPEVLWHVTYLLWLDHEARRAEGRERDGIQSYIQVVSKNIPTLQIISVRSSSRGCRPRSN